MANEDDDKRVARLDEVAKVVLTATSLTAAALTAFGVTSDRIPHLFDIDRSRMWLFVAGFCAAGALGFALAGLASSKWQLEFAFLMVGLVALVGGLMASVAAAAVGFSGNGRPTITDVMTEGRRPAVSVSFKVRADGVDPDERIRVESGPRRFEAGTWVSTNANTDFSASLRPDDKGVIEQEVKITFDVSTDAQRIAIRAYRQRDRQGLAEIKHDCNVSDQAVAPGCADLPIPPLPAR